MFRRNNIIKEDEMPKALNPWSAERVIYHIAEDELNRDYPRRSEISFLSGQITRGLKDDETRKIFIFTGITLLLFALDFVISLLK